MLILQLLYCSFCSTIAGSFIYLGCMLVKIVISLWAAPTIKVMSALGCRPCCSLLLRHFIFKC